VANAVLTQVYRNRALKGDFTPGFSLDLAAKDQALLLQMGKDLGADLPLSTLVLERFKEAQRRGLGAEDFTAVIKLMEERLGVQVRLEG
jgi:4-hydroxybutyrate dehydrogenase/sulfolactaldehyde 3-reductase